MVKYYSELLRVKNKTTGKMSFYVKKCGVFSRISELEYDIRFQSSDGVSNFFTKTTETHERHYSTVIFWEGGK